MTTQFHIPPLAPETLFYVGNFAITNTLINAWLAMSIFLVLGILISRNIKEKPGKLQNAGEFILEMLLPYFDQVTGERKKTVRFLPIVGSIFFFILLSNWLGLLPGTGSLFFGHDPVLRPANSDLNLTLAMALVAVIGSHVYAFATIGIFTHLGKFIQIKNILKSFVHGPMAVMTALIEFFVGILEIISEMAKVLSLSLRLFGNILAGEVLITVMSTLMAFLIPAPFMLLELLVGLIQASVFAMLTLVYMTVATSLPHGEH